MNNIKEYKYLILVIMIVVAAVIFSNKIDYKDEIAKQDLVLKCEEVYNVKHINLENTRYKNHEADSVIWSPKTKTCLAYYNVPQENPGNFLFEVWDYTNSDLILSYRSNRSQECIQNGVIISMQNFIYKYNKKLEGSGCDLTL